MKHQPLQPNRKEFEKLLSQKGPVVSLLSAPPSNPADPEKVRISVKHAVQQAETQLELLSPNKESFEEQLQSLKEESGLTDAWKGCSQAIAIYLFGDGSQQRYWVDSSLEDGKGVVGGSPLLRPLFEASAKFGSYSALLQVGKDEIAAFQLSGAAGEEFADLSATLADVLTGYEGERSLQHHATSKSGGEIQHHGHGSAGDDAVEKDKAVAFYQAWARERRESLAALDDPVVLGGTDTYTALFRESISDLKFAPFTVVPRAREHFPSVLEEMEEKATVVEKERAKEKVDQFLSLDGSKQVFEHTDEMIAELVKRKVDTLFLRPDFHSWTNQSSLNFDNLPISILAGEEIEMGDLLTKAAYQQGGEIVFVEEGNDSIKTAAVKLRG